MTLEKKTDPAAALLESYRELGSVNHIDGLDLPSSAEIVDLTERLLALVLPGFFGSERLTEANLAILTAQRLYKVRDELTDQMVKSISYVCRKEKDCDGERCLKKAAALSKVFLTMLPKVRLLLNSDIEAAFDGDPACFSKEEVIICYPGFFFGGGHSTFSPRTLRFGCAAYSAHHDGIRASSDRRRY